MGRGKMLPASTGRVTRGSQGKSIGAKEVPRAHKCNQGDQGNQLSKRTCNKRKK